MWNIYIVILNGNLSIMCISSYYIPITLGVRQFHSNYQRIYLHYFISTFFRQYCDCVYSVRKL